MRIVLITLSLILGACGCQTPPDVPVTSSKLSTPTGSGSAFAISPTEVLTGWHVVVGMPIELTTIDGQSPSSVRRLGTLDAALLTYPEGHGLPVFPIRTTPLGPAEPVTLSGWGAGLHWWTRGTSTSDPRRFSLDIAPGDSGAPVMDAQGRVVGIVMARGRLANHHAFIVPIREVMDQIHLLTSHPSPETQSQ